MAKPPNFNIALVVQNGRLQYEALLFLASLRRFSPGFGGTVFLAEPQPGPLWPDDPRVRDPDLRAALTEFGGTFLPFENKVFGASYPQGNKIEMLSALPKDQPFVVFDTDTLITGDLTSVPFDFARPSASLRREGTWPKPRANGPGYAEIWRALYDRFGLDFDSSQDPQQPKSAWQRYLYFNAGFFYHTCPHRFGARYLRYATEIRDDPPPQLAGQKLIPWLDQIALPLVIHALGGGRTTLPVGLLDGRVSCHYRLVPLLYARESDHSVAVLEEVARMPLLKPLLQRHAPLRRLVYEGDGQKLRAMFDRNALPEREQVLRKRLKQAGFWMR